MPSTPPKTPSKKRRRANRSSEEEVYAGPTQSLPSQTPLSPTSNPITPVAVRQRLQRANGVAQSEEAVEQDGLKIGRDRVGTMPLPRLPAIFQALGPSHHAYSFGSDLRLEAFRVLERNGVGIQACEVGHRSGRFDPREQHQLPVALVIWSTEEYHHLWRAVCVELRDFVTRASPPMPIGIEILDITAEEVTRSFPLYSDDPIVLSWSFVESPILSILLETDASLMTAVRRGKGDLPRENPETVYISVPEETETDWIYVRDRIVEVLDDNELPGVAVEISRGTPCEYGSFGSQELPDTIWEDAAVPGISIGPLGSRRPYSSTLGGFVQLEDAEGDWRTFGLTCYHAVFPPKPTDDLNFEAEGMLPQYYVCVLTCRHWLTSY